MRFLVLTQYYPPEAGAPQARLSEMIRRLQGMGHEVTVLTALPNYPTGRIFDGYRGRFRVRETIEGVDVIRTWLLPSQSPRFLPRLACYISFAVSALLLGVWGVGRKDLVLIESPPLFLAPAGFVIAALTRAKPVLMVADIWPDILIQMGNAKPGLLVSLMYWLESFCYNHSAVVTLTTPGMCQEIRNRFPHLPNVTILSNGVDTTMFRPDLRSDATRLECGAGPGEFLVGYCGLHGLAQGLEIVVDAAARLKSRPEIRFVMIGDGPTKESIVQKARKLNLTNLKILAQVPKKAVPPIIASFDVSLMPLRIRIPGAMPSKVFEALASGAVPIVAKGTDADLLVTDKSAGLSYEPGDVDDLVRCITRLVDDRVTWRSMRDNDIALARRFDRNILAERSAAILTAVAENRKVPEFSW